MNFLVESRKTKDRSLWLLKARMALSEAVFLLLSIFKNYELQITKIA